MPTPTAPPPPPPAEPSPLELKVEAELLRRDFYTFVRAAWPVVEPGGAFVDSWTVGAIAQHLQAVTEGKLRRLIINVPPRFTKSLLTCVFWPAWEWARDPRTKWLFASYAQTLATRDSVRMRRLLQSPWYQARFPHVQLADDQNLKMRYETTAGGYRIATSFGGVATGDGGDRRVIDDPHKADDVHSDLVREGQLEWWAETWSTRTIDAKTDADVVIMQRLHERDLSGHILEEVGGYEHLCLPMRFEPERACRTSIGWRDPRELEGELLNPKRFGPDEVAELERKLGEYGTAGQFQQAPAPSGGGILKEHWFEYWQPPGTDLGPVKVRTPDGFVEKHPRTLPDEDAMDRHLQSWDLTFKKAQDGSRVAGQAWSQHGADAFLIDQVADRLDFTETVRAIEAFSAQYPQHQTKLIEDKANGPAVISTLKSTLGGFIEVEPYGTKEARAHAVSPRVQSGNVYLPHPRLYPWVERFRKRVGQFPATSDSDETDALTQALDHMPANGETYAQAVKRTRSRRAGGRR